jgi:hypothetical protein
MSRTYVALITQIVKYAQGYAIINGRHPGKHD